MKKIEVVYRNRFNMDAILYLEGILKKIFEEYVEIENCFVDELSNDSQVNADAYIVIDKKLLPELKKHIFIFKNAVIMTRSARKEHLPKILKIPKNTDVLIVNDTLQSAEEMVYMFYELGIGHVNFIPYDEKLEMEGFYDKIEYAITPNEPQLVPKHIKNVINTGYREIGFDTLLQTMNILDLNNERVNYNLIRHISSIIEPLKDFQINYFDSYLKEQMLNEYVYDSDSSIFVIDSESRVVYFNKKAKKIFGFNQNSSAPVEHYVSDEIRNEISKPEDISKQMVSIDGLNYIMNKVSLVAAEQKLGYFVTLQDEIVIKDMETSLNRKLKERGLFAKYNFNSIIYASSTMKQSIELAKKAALTNYTILISGESGTGKELFAQSIHNYSERSNMPFVGVNCAALPESLLESELFGYEEGAFTGARKKGKLGYFEQANKGTIFLDEIGDISPKLQSGLLRVLQERQIMRIGSDKVIDIDVRIIAATNKDLLQEVKKENFRNDLYYRLNVLQILVPPLRNRKEDILLIFEEFTGKDYRYVSSSDKKKILNYDWPGNVRELESCALYYKMLKKLPPLFEGSSMLVENRKEILKNGVISISEVKEQILKLLMDNNEIGHGLGRTELARMLKMSYINVSDVKLRKILSDMQKEGLVDIGIGRQGTRITEKGLQKLIVK